PAPPLAHQSDRARTEALSRRAAERLQSLQREADRLAAEEQTLIGDVRKLEIERAIKAEQFQNVDAQLKDVTTELAASADRMRQLEERDLAERPGRGARVVELDAVGLGRLLRRLLSAVDLRGGGRG